jgi:polyribonucleotide nucleotidyltransferase
VKVTVECEVGGRTLSLTTGEIAKQASGAVIVRYADTVVFVAAQSGPPRPGIDFFPLQVDYRERMAASGRFAGGFLSAAGRPHGNSYMPTPIIRFSALSEGMSTR